MTANMLSQAIELARAGKKVEARKILVQILNGDLHNEDAWLWLAETMPTTSQRRATLEKCLQYNPNSQVARRAFEDMRSRQADPDAASTSADTVRPLMEAIRKPPVLPSPLEKDDATQSEPPASPAKAGPATRLAKPKSKQPAKGPKSAKQTAIPAGPTRPPKKTRRVSSPLKKADTPQGEPSVLPSPPEKADTLQDEPPVLPTPLEKAESLQGEPLVPLSPVEKTDDNQTEPPVLPSPLKKAESLQTKPLVPPSTLEKVESLQTKPLVPPSPLEKVESLQTKPLVPPSPLKKADAIQSEPPVSAAEAMLGTRLAMFKPTPPVGDPKAAGKPSIPTGPARPPQKPPRTPPPQKKSRRMNTLDAVMFSLIVLFLIGIAGFLLWEQYGSSLLSPLIQAPSNKPEITAEFLETQNAQMRVTLTAVQARQLTNASQPLPTQTPTPTVSPTSTHTPLMSPTPTLDVNSPSILFMDPANCTVRQVDVNGAASTLTGTPPSTCKDAQLSPDGKKVFYLIQEGDPNNFIQSLYVMNVDGSSPVKVLDKAQYLYQVDWSPDSNWLSYAAICGTNQAGPVLCLNLVSADGNGSLQLTNGKGGSLEPSADMVSWSPDGRWLAFVGGLIPQIVRSDGTGLAKLANDHGYFFMAWSSDSQNIAYYSPDGAGIKVADLHANLHLLHSLSLTTPMMGQNLAWAPDGNHLVYLDTSLRALALVSLDNVEVKLLVHLNGWVNHLAWSPDGSRLAFIELPDASKPAGALKVVNADGSGESTLVDSLQDVPFTWKMPGEEQTVTPITIILPTPTSSQ